MKKGAVLVLGARSDIVMTVAHRLAKEGYDIQLAARNAESLTADRSDIALRYHVEVSLHEFDALDFGSHAAFVDALPELPRIAVCAAGYMGNQEESERDAHAATMV
ncbi:hypothetical protein AB2B41_11985 [Marimonas sp. MJW-29]|uniref:Short-chain dehydrogenase n=1 Tax=Sulfitobacter sediminis TaxID=3234186 RepID=A0ABV3RP14_9RHOB